MIDIRPLATKDSVALAALARRPEVVRFGDHLASEPPERWAAWIAPTNPHAVLSLAALEADQLKAAAKLTLIPHRRRVHVALVHIVASGHTDSDAPLDALLRALIETSDRWLSVVRLELVCPAGHRRIEGLFAAHGFAVEAHRRASLLTDGSYVDEVALARLRPGITLPPALEPEVPSPAPSRTGSPPALVFRDVGPEDAPTLARSLSEPDVVRGTLQVPWQASEGWAERLRTNDPRRLFQVGAEVEGKLVASGTLGVPETFRRRHVVGLGMHVATAYQGQGIGRRLLAELLATADRLGFTRVELSVFPDNLRAVRIYDEAGFVREGVERCYAVRDGTYADTLEMARIAND